MERYKKQIAYNYTRRSGSIKYIVVHDTGNTSRGADAKSHYNYFNGGNRGSSADVFVDDHSVWVVNDYRSRYAWHCGDGGGKYGITNANSVGVEMCVNSDGNYDKAFANTVEVVKELMAELGIDASHVVRHYDASRKNCPASMSGNGWARWQEFKNQIQEELTMTQYEDLKQEITNLKTTLANQSSVLNGAIELLKKLSNPMIYNYIDENMPEWARASVQKAVNKGYLKGDGDGLNLDDNLLRILVLLDRANVFGN